MEKQLISYLKNTLNKETVYIDNYVIDGSVCTVNFYTHENSLYKENININVWDMLIFFTNKSN